jgi:hypothetical protein
MQFQNPIARVLAPFVATGWIGLGAGCGVTSESAPAASPRSESIAPAWDSSADQSTRLRGGDECFAWLSHLGIHYERLSAKPGVADPVRVLGPIGGIDFITLGKSEVVCDCRMVLALDWSARTLAALGVTAIRHSGAYVYRTTKSGKPSLHARGLAIDVHGVQIGPYTHWVKEHFARGRTGRCAADDPALNRVECQLRSLGLFRELITPDHNYDHRDHLHLGISPLVR